MMAMSRDSDCKSSGSCKNSGNSRSSCSESSSSSGSRCSRSDGSCGHAVHVRKKLKGHTGLQCRCFSCRKSKHTRKRCKDSVVQHAGTSRGYCHISKESKRHFKRTQSRNGSSHECCIGTSREEDDQECSVRKQICQHCHSKFSNGHFRRHFSCNWCTGSCPSRLLLSQEPDELTRVYYNQRRRKLCSSHKRHDCRHYCHHHEHKGSICEKHPSLTGIDCRSDRSKEISMQVAGINAGVEKIPAPMEGHGPLKGDFRSEGLASATNIAFTPEFIKAQQKDWLTLNLAKPPKPIIADFNIDDITLGLPGNAPPRVSKVTQDIDLNVTAKDYKRSFTDICAPAVPLSRDYGSRTLHRLSDSSQDQDFNNYKSISPVSGSKKGVDFGTGSCQKDNNIIILDDTDDENLQNDNQKMDVCLGYQRTEVKEEDSSTLIKESVTESVDDCTAHGRNAEKSTAWEDNNFESTCIQVDKDETVVAVEKPESGWCETKEGTDSITQNSTGQSEMIVKDPQVAAVHSEILGVSCKGFKPRKKRMIDKKSLPLLNPEEIDSEVNASDEPLVGTVTVQKSLPLLNPEEIDSEVTASDEPLNGTVIVQKAVLSKMLEAKPRMWEGDILCDLCHKGPCLSMGEWYAWCCGLRLHSCGCSPAFKTKLKLAISIKKSNKPKKTDGVVWSGMVHKMCALWSSEVYEEGEGLQGLLDAVKRGKLLICAACKEYGATLGCRVKICRRSFHYPCADELASKLCCRMWDGVHQPVACRGHRYVSQSCTNAKEKPLNLRKWRFRGFVSRKRHNVASGTPLQADQSPLLWNSAFKEQYEVARGAFVCLQPGPSVKENCMDMLNKVIDISTDSEDEIKRGVENSGVQCVRPGLSNPAVLGPSNSFEISLKGHQLNIQETGQCRPEDSSGALYHMGSNLLCEDISCGREVVLIPCTNDVDSDPAPVVNYIIENRYLGRAKSILESLLQDKTRAADTCKGCDINSIDDPHIEASVHAALSNFQRESDTRFDWQGQSMLGRLPYDRFGRLQLGPDTKDIVECNSRCPCGVDCLNRELQRGIRIPLEVFKTKDRGWSVRTMEPICRGKFVVEYIGEVLTHDEAHVRGIQYDQSNLSCLFSADHPDVPAEDLLVIDGFQMSNVARFINHSCDGNLRVYRVYTETSDLRFCRIGLYALRDIEIGEELSYDYSYVVCKDANTEDFSTDPTAIKCLCGASNCRHWLWTGTSR